jgi:RNA polymerase sigma-70 factor (ECF subfamily)
MAHGFGFIPGASHGSSNGESTHFEPLESPFNLALDAFSGCTLSFLLSRVRAGFDNRQPTNMETLAKNKARRRGKDDHSLVEMAVNGNQRAFSILMERHQSNLLITIQKIVPNRVDAEDLALESFGKAFSNLGTYRPQHAFGTWLQRIAINHCIDHKRKRRLPTCSIDSQVNEDFEWRFSENIRAKAMNPEESLICAQKQALVRTLITQLNERYQQMVEMRYFQNLTYAEIAAEMQVPLGTVKAQLHRAREILHELLCTPDAAAY